MNDFPATIAARDLYHLQELAAVGDAGATSSRSAAGTAVTQGEQ